MSRPWSSLCAVLLLCAAMAGAADGGADAAAALVERLSLGASFADLAHQVASKTQTYRALVQAAVQRGWPVQRG